MPTAAFYILSTVCQYLTLYRLLVVCHYVHCCLLQSVHCLSVPHTVQSVGSLSLCPLLSSTVIPLCFSTSHCTVCCPYVTMSTAAFYSLFTFCQYLKLYRHLVLCHYGHRCLLQSMQCQYLTPCRLLVLCHYVTAAFYSLSAVCQYLTFYRLLVLCHYVHCCLLQSVHCLSVPHTIPSVGSVSLCPMLLSTVCPPSVSTSNCTVCWFCVTKSSAAF